MQAFYKDASSELVDKVLAGENDKTFEEYTEEMQLKLWLHVVFTLQPSKGGIATRVGVLLC